MSMKPSVCICTICGAEETYIFSSSFPPPSALLLSLIELIQILVLLWCCSSFFRLKAMCHSLLLSLCLFLHLFLPLPPTQSLSPLPTPFSPTSVDVIVCALHTACVHLRADYVFCVCWCGDICGVPTCRRHTAYVPTPAHKNHKQICFSLYLVRR